MDFEKELEGAPAGDETFYAEAKKRGFSDAYIAEAMETEGRGSLRYA